MRCDRKKKKKKKSKTVGASNLVHVGELGACLDVEDAPARDVEPVLEGPWARRGTGEGMDTGAGTGDG